MDKQKLDRTIFWICAVILFGLALRNAIIAEQFDCNKCKVELINEVAGGQEYLFGVFWIPELYNEYYENGTCALTWSPVQGYVYG